MPSAVLVEHFFRHEYGRLVAALVRSFGVSHLELVEDAVQAAMLNALRSWGPKGAPANPGAWLARVARNQVLDAYRRRAVAARHTADEVATSDPAELLTPEADPSFIDEVEDDQLRMLFVCCDEELPPDSQVALALKTLCGFSVSEIARRLLTTEVNVQKRLGRARARLMEHPPSFETPSPERLGTRLKAVQHVVYLLFTEGYSSAQPEQVVRRELCEEALRLGHLLVQNRVGDEPNSWALLSLMHFHVARLDSRVDATGALLLLEDQDRSLWNREHIQFGFELLQRATEKKAFSRYHALAAILAEHCFAPSFEATRWGEIVGLYEMLERIENNPLHTLNRAIAVAQVQGPDAALAIIEQVKPPAWLTGYYLWDASIGELLRRAGRLDGARRHLARALDVAPTNAERELISQRLRLCAE